MIDIYKKAIETFGEDSQIDMALEEMSELTKALLKHRRAVKSGEVPSFKLIDNIAEEIADVQIMIDQLTMIFDNGKDVDKIMRAKADRLADRIEAYKK